MVTYVDIVKSIRVTKRKTNVWYKRHRVIGKINLHKKTIVHLST